RKLRGIVAAELHIDVAVPPALSTVRDAIRRHRSLLVRYLSQDRDESTERELLPLRAWSKWGHWYLTARDATETTPKQFRVDRMLEARVGSLDFDPPDDVEVPEWFDLSEHDRTVRVRTRAAALESLPAPHRLGPTTDLGDGRVELDITVLGDRRIEQLLLCLEPDDEVVAPPEYAELRRTHAARLLTRYDGLAAPGAS
ncbi:MAG TPA: WYL domain-containing protein, partial [Gaiellaceae bacterium]|nr:WYL domain-containing protein [Gaiellaceae bacterium]